MSVCTFLAADYELPTFAPSQDYSFHVNVDDGTIYDGGANDNYFLIEFKEVDLYTDKDYGVYLEWDYTDGRANNILNYIKDALQNTDSVELWHVWLMDYYDFEESPVIFSSTISIDDLTIYDIKEINNAPIFNHPDERYPDRPSFYCLKIVR